MCDVSEPDSELVIRLFGYLKKGLIRENTIRALFKGKVKMALPFSIVSMRDSCLNNS